MDDHASWLVDDDNRVVFVCDCQWNRFAEDLANHELGMLDDDDVSGDGTVASLFAPPIHRHIAVRDKRRRLIARNVAAPGHKQIEADVTVRLDQILAAPGRGQISLLTGATGVTDDA